MEVKLRLQSTDQFGVRCYVGLADGIAFKLYTVGNVLTRLNCQFEVVEDKPEEPS